MLKIKKYFFPILFALIFSVLLCLFFSYKLLDVPMGLTGDETAFGYNASLLSKTGHDENGRFLPLFVLANNGTDWKQPITQYYLAFLFWLFKPSVFLLRFSSILITLLSSFLLYKFARKVFDQKYSLLTVLIFLTTPLIMIQSHMGLDNIMTIPFAIIWFYFLYLYEKNKNIKFLIVSALSLGINFYTYKGMRAVFPIWYLLSLIYIFKNPILKNIKQFFIFSLFSLPFFLISPLLNHYYPGAIFGGARPVFDNLYNFLYPYFSSYDLTFLFIKGDELLFHSTGYHGFFLLASMPLFFIGIYKSIKTNKFSRFILLIFFTTPLLYGSVNSVHRASRLMCLIPFYAIICTYGFQYLVKISANYKKIVIFIVLFLSLANYYDFLHHYYGDYRKLTQNFLGDLKPYLSFKKLKTKSEELNLKPYMATNISNNFFESIYFTDNLNYINPDLLPPPGSILLTNRSYIEGMTNLNIDIKYYYLQIRNQ
ncbi:MAG: glycosyltransferase family 39 protein [Candidatus Shapirobacteria bacterium]|nr:glycosyltransferase family 39 protein [Candidatus Shapirobacteria bacterium]MDD4410556.1 glycosyltransferase family 39 protein [Candidatus Shapirobacteria bacterium]